MADATEISWCDRTFNPWWGCVEPPSSPGSREISPECLNCYAKAWDHRMGGAHWGVMATRKFASDAYWLKPERWNAAAKASGRRQAVFCQSMGDWAELHADPEVNARLDAERARLWKLIRLTPWLDWLMLTKRAERLPELLPWMNLAKSPPSPLCRDSADKALNDGICDHDGMPCDPREPWPNVWVGVTCGARSSLWRIAMLRRIRAAVRFVSGEPLLDHITAAEWDVALGRQRDYRRSGDGTGPTPDLPPVNWLIVGDESGYERRPIGLDDIRVARDAALRNNVRFHFKQWHEGSGGKARKTHLPVLDNKVWNQRGR